LLLLWKEKSAIGGFRISRALARAAMSLAEQQAALIAKLKDLGIDTKTVGPHLRGLGSRVLWIAVTR